MKKIKVLEVIRQGEIGGGESHLIDLIDGISNQVKVIVLSFTDGHMIQVLESKSIKCYVLNNNKPFNLFIQRTIIDIIKKERINIIHSHGSRAASNMIFSSYFLKIPMVYTVHGWSFHEDQNFITNYLRKISERIICNLSKQVICVSKSNKQYGKKNISLSSDAIVIENGVNLSVFNPLKCTNIRKELDLLENDVVIGFIGRVTKQKSPFDFINSIAISHEIDNRIKGLIVGNGDMEEEIKEYIDQKGYNSFIILHNFRNDIPNVLHSIDVFVLPSLWEGLSIALLEAMAMRKAIVATPTDGTKEIIKNMDNGIIVPFNNPNRLAEAYIYLINNEHQKNMFADNAYHSIEERFSSSRVSQQVLSIYNSIIS